jgi:hypothetical protein
MGRTCPGVHFADASLFLTIASVLATFTILRPLDEDGNEVTPPEEFIDDMLTCVIVLFNLAYTHVDPQLAIPSPSNVGLCRVLKRRAL